MRKKVIIFLSALAFATVLGGIGYAASYRETAPVTASETTDAGNTVTVQGTPLAGGGCSYSFFASPSDGSTAVPVTVQDIPIKDGNGSSGSMSIGPVSGGPSGTSVQMISQDRSNCRAIFEIHTSGESPAYEVGNSTSSVARPPQQIPTRPPQQIPSVPPQSPAPPPQISANTATSQVTPAGMAKIAFNSLSSNGARFNTYAESGFKVSAVSGSWEVMASYGNPAPAIIFKRSANEPTATGVVEITRGGSAFSFQSVDLYSSMTPIPYAINGYRNSKLIFSLSKTVPNTFGNFATVRNPETAETIDRLTISLSNPATECCQNPVGLDNIVLGY
ncbi:MAG: hypothetical protein ACYCXU_05450 [Thermoleophilia bacterium]